MKKHGDDYRILLRFDTVHSNGSDRLIKPIGEDKKLRFYVSKEDLFEVINEIHVSSGHGGRNRTKYDANEKYANITKEAIMVYLPLCAVCQKKSSNKRKGLVSKPIVEKKFNSRAQLDLIDMQSQEYNGYRFIFNYQDHLTKFVSLRPLKTKTAEEVAFNLLKVYTIFGAPAILHHDNGREFVNKVLVELHNMWDDIKIVRRKPRHSQSQGSVERANRDVEEMLSAWMQEKNSRDWPNGLDIVQFRKNNTFHSGE